LLKHLLKLFLNRIKQFKQLKQKNIAEDSQQYGIKFIGNVQKVVYSLCQLYSYKQNEYTLFDFISMLLFKITNSHSFNNGNKRTAIYSIAQILNSFGFYLKWSSKNEILISFWEEFMLKISVAETFNNNGDIIKYIKEILISNSWMKL